MRPPAASSEARRGRRRRGLIRVGRAPSARGQQPGSPRPGRQPRPPPAAPGRTAAASRGELRGQPGAGLGSGGAQRGRPALCCCALPGPGVPLGLGLGCLALLGPSLAACRQGWMCPCPSGSEPSVPGPCCPPGPYVGWVRGVLGSSARGAGMCRLCCCLQCLGWALLSGRLLGLSRGGCGVLALPGTLLGALLSPAPSAHRGEELRVQTVPGRAGLGAAVSGTGEGCWGCWPWSRELAVPWVSKKGAETQGAGDLPGNCLIRSIRSKWGARKGWGKERGGAKGVASKRSGVWDGAGAAKSPAGLHPAGRAGTQQQSSHRYGNKAPSRAKGQGAARTRPRAAASRGKEQPKASGAGAAPSTPGPCP